MIRYLIDTEGCMVRADSIQQHPENYNNGDIDGIIESIETNGVYRKLLVSTRTRDILGGNNLYAALIEMNADYVPVEWVDADADTEYRILLVDNEMARRGRYDEALLWNVLRKVYDREKNLLGTGHDAASMARLAAINHAPM